MLVDIIKRLSVSRTDMRISNNAVIDEDADQATNRDKDGTADGMPRIEMDQRMMLIAAAVTMAPPEEREDFLMSLSANERRGAMQWMEPQDLAEVLALGNNTGQVLEDMAMDVLKPAFACLSLQDRCTVLNRCGTETAVELLTMLDVRIGKTLLGNLSHHLRSDIMGLLPMEWLRNAAADTDPELLNAVLLDLSATTGDAVLSLLPTDRQHDILSRRSDSNQPAWTPIKLNVSGLSNFNTSAELEDLGHCSLLLPEDSLRL